MLSLFVHKYRYTSIFSCQQSCSSSATYGYTSCMKDGLVKLCGSEYSNLLDTAYYDIVEDVIGEGFGCEESTPIEPLLGKNPL